MPDESTCPSISSQAEVEWRELADFPGYRISSEGDVQSRRLIGIHKNGPNKELGMADQWRNLKPYLTGKPNKEYLGVNLRSREWRICRVKIHRLVLETFVGPCPEGMEACHNDGDRFNNRLSNLRWDTSSNNNLDMRRHGTACIGESNPVSKLTAEQVIEIRQRWANGESAGRLSRVIGITQTVISKIVRGDAWSHLPVIDRDPSIKGRRVVHPDWLCPECGIRAKRTTRVKRGHRSFKCENCGCKWKRKIVELDPTYPKRRSKWLKTG